MKIKRKDSTRTKERLVFAASEVFAKKDYVSATIAEICERAGANVAAVNYYFGDKETLYREAWRHAFRMGMEAHPADGGVDNDAPPEERLRGAIRAFMGRITDVNDREFLIVNREMTNPTGLLRELMETELLPIHGRMESMVHELLGTASTPERVQFCAISIMNQCLHPMLKTSTSEDATNIFHPRIDMASFINHTVLFSLGGIRAVAEEVQMGHLRKYNRGKGTQD